MAQPRGQRFGFIVLTECGDSGLLSRGVLACLPSVNAPRFCPHQGCHRWAMASRAAAASSPAEMKWRHRAPASVVHVAETLRVVGLRRPGDRSDSVGGPRVTDGEWLPWLLGPRRLRGRRGVIVLRAGVVHAAESLRAWLRRPGDRSEPVGGMGGAPGC